MSSDTTESESDLDTTWSSNTLEMLAFDHKNGLLSTSSEDEEDEEEGKDNDEPISVSALKQN